MYKLLRPLLFALPPELVHKSTLSLLSIWGRLASKDALQPRNTAPSTPLKGLYFANPVGLAAGLDKDAECIDGLGRLGFGFIEVGTVTPQPQPGNPSPRLFRVPNHRALINRFGFNSLGVDALVNKLVCRRYTGVLGVNIGKNAKTSNDQAINDYRHCLERIYAYSDYVTVNLSSPNTPGLRQLQATHRFMALMSSLLEQRDGLSQIHDKHVPLLVKISPDLSSEALKRLIDNMLEVGVEGLVATNTTVVHPATLSEQEQRLGGLSGSPLYQHTLAIIKQIRQQAGEHLVIIGAGGIMSSQDAEAVLAAGADLLQFYTGLIYEGPGLPRRILAGLHNQPAKTLGEATATGWVG